MLPPEESESDPLVQMNVRVRKSTRDRIDARRKGRIDPKTGRPLSRDRWVENAAIYALDAPNRPTSNTIRRTAPPR